MSPLVFVLLGQIATDPVGAGDLATAAAASPRPQECRATERGREGSATFWRGVSNPALRAYCRELARGYSALGHAPAAALAAADAAEKKVGGRAATRVLSARAALALGKPQAAQTAFAEAIRLDRREVRSPGALRDLAVASVLTGQAADAVAAFRALVPRANLLDHALERQRAYVEAACAVMELGPSLAGGDGAGGDGDGDEATRNRLLDEVIGYLAEARRRPALPGFRSFVLGALALALDRRGRREEARGIAREAGGPWSLVMLVPEPETDAPPAVAPAWVPIVPAGTLQAMVAALASGHDEDVARERWAAYLEARGDGPWADHARRAGGS